MRHVLKVGSMLVLPLLLQTWVADDNPVRAQSKTAKPPTVHAPHSSSQASVLHKDIEFQVSDEVKVRRYYAPDQYDEKGKARKPTAAELKELKGPDPKQPGYNADVYDLKNGQVVQIQLWKKKEDPKASDKAPADNKKADPKPAADNKKADAKNGDNATKSEWVLAGTLVGTLKAYQPSSKKMTVTINTTTLNGKHHRTQTNGKGKITMPDVEVRMAMIMSKELPPKDVPDKKNK